MIARKMMKMGGKQHKRERIYKQLGPRKRILINRYNRNLSMR